MKVDFNVRKIVICSMCCALTCIMAMFAIPIGPVPITLANFAVYISGALLGEIYGPISQLLYVILIFVGFPFTSKFVGGPSYIFGPTGGYILGYIAMAFVLGFIYKKFGSQATTYKRKMIWFIIGATIGTIICYFFGTIWYITQAKTEFFSALTVCVVPFFPGDAVKIIFSGILVPKLENALGLES